MLTISASAAGCPESVASAPASPGSLTFIPPRKMPHEEAVTGVEWSFINSDMVIQQGGLRWIP